MHARIQLLYAGLRPEQGSKLTPRQQTPRLRQHKRIPVRKGGRAHEALAGGSEAGAGRGHHVALVEDLRKHVPADQIYSTLCKTAK